MEQRSEEWYEIKRGKVSASQVSNVLMTKTTAGYRNYRAQLVAEKITGKTDETYTNDAMQRGIELEGEARLNYEFETMNKVTEEGFIIHPLIEDAGASPDGIIFEDGSIEGLVEIKCPGKANHLDYLLSKKCPAQYVNQVQWQMSCIGGKWCDFVSYNPDFPEKLQLSIVRVERDNKKIAELEAAVIDFLKEVDEMVKTLEEI